MPFTRLDFKPGINKEITSYAGEGGWYESDKVRFRGGRPEKMGGWDKYHSTAVTGIPRAIKAWRDNSGNVILAIGTHSKLYIEVGGLLYDVTPLRVDDAALGNDPFATTNGSTTVTVTHASHGAEDGDYVTFSSATATGGVPASELNANHQITYVNSNSFTISVTTAASSATSGGGASVTGDYEINIGAATGTYGLGWGASTWGGTPTARHWGSAAASSSVMLYPRTWSLDLWGEDLIANPKGKEIYHIDISASLGTRATLISNAPREVNRIAVTQDRHLVAFGCDQPGGTGAKDALMVRWCAQEDKDDWTPTAENTAGNQLLTGGTKIQSVARIEGQLLVWTDVDIHSMQFIGPPYTFGFQQVGTNCGIIGPEAFVSYNGMTFWMSCHNLYVYDGAIRILDCTVLRHVFDSINPSSFEVIFAGLNKEFHEVTWYYPVSTIENTTLNGAITDSATTITVATTAGYQKTGSVMIGTEVITYTGKTDATFTGCSRGQSGTSAAAHSDGDTVSVHPSTTTNAENSNYVTYNFLENVWYVGRLERTAWTDRGVLKYPTGTDSNGYIFNHEKGTDSDVSPMVSVLESSDFDIGEGDKMTFAKKLIPDFTIDSGTVDMSFLIRKYPNSSQVDGGTVSVSSSTEKVNIRMRGRQASLQLSSDDLGDNWRYGSPRVDIIADGRK